MPSATPAPLPRRAVAMPLRAERAAPPRPPRPDRAFSQVVQWSLGLSLLLHLLLFVAWPRSGRLVTTDPADVAVESQAAQGMTMIDGSSIVVTDAVAEPARADALLARPAMDASVPAQRTLTEQPRAWRSPPNASPATGPQAPTTGAAGAQPGTGGQAGRGDNPFRTAPLDPRLRVSERDVPQPSDHERYMAHLEGRLQAYNDSVAGAAEAARRATDWTVKDKNGRRWGVSPGGVHLGGVTVPVPMQAAGTAEGAQRSAEERRRRGEIQGQGEAFDRDRAREESIRRTRERNDAERERRRNGGG